MQPFSLLIKPAGPDCNLACPYCFYNSRADMFPPGSHRMNDDVLEKLIAGYMKLKPPTATFAFQGGEPTLMGLDFFKKVVDLQKKNSPPGQIIANALQTNAILLDDQWCQFLSEYKWLVGISLDGPKKYHDHYRRDKSGTGTFDQVIAAIETCRKHKVQFNILTLLNDQNVKYPDELFDFFVSLNIEYLQFVPCVERNPSTNKIAPYSISADDYGNFLCKIFDRWYEFGPKKISIRLFDSILNYLIHSKHSNCTFNRKCDDYVVIEHNGDLFCCDFFVSDEYKLGNIMENDIEDLIFGPKKRKFAQQKRDLNNKCLVCTHNSICRGGCLKHRTTATNAKFSNPSYFCTAYKQFFDHALSRLKQISADLLHR